MFGYPGPPMEGKPAPAPSPNPVPGRPGSPPPRGFSPPKGLRPGSPPPSGLNPPPIGKPKPVPASKPKSPGKRALRTPEPPRPPAGATVGWPGGGGWTVGAPPPKPSEDWPNAKGEEKRTGLEYWLCLIGIMFDGKC